MQAGGRSPPSPTGGGWVAWSPHPRDPGAQTRTRGYFCHRPGALGRLPLDLLGLPGAKGPRLCSCFPERETEARARARPRSARRQSEARNRTLVPWPCRRLTPTSVRSIRSQLALKPTPAVTKSPAPGRQPTERRRPRPPGWGCGKPGHPGLGLGAFAHAGVPALSGLSWSPLGLSPGFVVDVT